MKYKSIKIGQTASLKHKITEGDVNTFVQLTGDDNKLHLDKAFAKQTDLKIEISLKTICFQTQHKRLF